MPVSRRLVLAVPFLLWAASAQSAPAFRFASIDGGQMDLADWTGRPVLVVNTASLCGFTPQYEGLQTLYERYAPQGLVVLAVPSDDFNQELASGEAVKDFCEVNFGLTFPMTEITPVLGPTAHPFYLWLHETHDITPRWNFHKVLLDRAGQPVADFTSNVRPDARKLRRAIEQALAG